MKDSFSQVRSGQIVRVLQNCCTRPSFIFEGIMINCHPVVYFPFIVSASELGVANNVSRNNHLFCHILYNLAMVQQKKKQAHAYSLSFHLHALSTDLRVLLFNIIRVFNYLLQQLLAILA